MQKACLLGVIILLRFSQIASTLVFLNFKIHQDYISEFLCVDKDKPESCCEGKCYLKAELEELSNSESNDAQRSTLWQDWRWLSNHQFSMNTCGFQTTHFYSFFITPLVIKNLNSPPSPPPQLL